MAAPEFSATYQYLAMSNGRGPQRADASGQWPPVVSPIRHNQRWEHELDRAFSYQANSPFLPPPLQHRDNPFPHQNYQQSPYNSYTGHGWPSMPMYPPSPFSFSTHQPRPPPAIRSGHVDALINQDRSGHDVHREASANYGSYYLGPQEHVGWSLPSPPAEPADIVSGATFSESRPTQAMQNEAVEQQTLPLHPGPSGPIPSQGPEQHQRGHGERNTANRQSEHAHLQTPRNPTAQTRRPDRSSSPRTSTRRSFNRYSADLSQSSTSSDAEEAAARSPPSNRVRHQSRESRLRFFRQVYDPNVTTESQIQLLKANLPKLLLGDLPEDASSTCDICAKDYSAIHVQPAEAEEVALKLPCGHTFGEFCINQWFETCKTQKNKVTCPMCRKQLIEPPRSPYTADRFDSGMFSQTMYLQAARSSQSFRELMANELHAQYARA